MWIERCEFMKTQALAKIGMVCLSQHKVRHIMSKNILVSKQDIKLLMCILRILHNGSIVIF